jgi:hypothetical protein
MSHDDESGILIDGENREYDQGGYNQEKPRCNTPQRFSIFALTAAVISAIVIIVVVSVLLTTNRQPCAKIGYDIATHVKSLGNSYGRLKNMTTLVFSYTSNNHIFINFNC